MPTPFDHHEIQENLNSKTGAVPHCDTASPSLPVTECGKERPVKCELVRETTWPGGLFYAVTPAYPSKAAFQDPTHVNIITAGTHTYFTQPQRQAAMYGFVGNFVLRRAPHWAKTRAAQAYVPVPQGLTGRLQVAHRAWRARRGATAHIVWEFEAVKP